MRFCAYFERNSQNNLRSEELKLSAKAERSGIDTIVFRDRLRVLRYLNNVGLIFSHLVILVGLMGLILRHLITR